jgi:hypothetical protein
LLNLSTFCCVMVVYGCQRCCLYFAWLAASLQTMSTRSR